MFSKVDYIMVNVSDMDRSVAYYRDTLGIPLTFASPGWSEFATGASILALHRVGAAAEGDLSVPPTAGTCSLGFSVENLDSVTAELQSRGAHFVMLPTEQPEEGIRLAVCIDPDGLAISFAERIVA